jgi:predicted transcriptional regulator
MKSRKLIISIKSGAKIKSELLQSLQNKTKKIQPKNQIIFNSVQSCMRILTKNRIEILIYLNHQTPRSIYELAKGLGRDFKNVHGDVRKLAKLGLISLEKSVNQRGGLIPKAKYTGIELSLVS